MINIRTHILVLSKKIGAEVDIISFLSIPLPVWMFTVAARILDSDRRLSKPLISKSHGYKLLCNHRSLTFVLYFPYQMQLETEWARDRKTCQVFKTCSFESLQHSQRLPGRLWHEPRWCMHYHTQVVRRDRADEQPPFGQPYAFSEAIT